MKCKLCGNSINDTTDSERKLCDACAIGYAENAFAGDAPPAKLLLAAPDLLAALQRYVQWQSGNFDAIDVEAEIFEPAKLAIAKATDK